MSTNVGAITLRHERMSGHLSYPIRDDTRIWYKLKLETPSSKHSIQQDIGPSVLVNPRLSPFVVGVESRLLALLQILVK